MKANTRMREHAAAARISVHLLSGHIRLHLQEQVIDLTAGHLLVLDQCVPHGVEAAEDSAFLLTLPCPPETGTEKSKTNRPKTILHKRE
jgi:quercetin dioxygenase-like cupin family protein